MNNKKFQIMIFILAVSFAGMIPSETDSFAGQVGGFDVEVGDGYYTWNEEQWCSDYNQQWNNIGDNTQQNWNDVEGNTQQNWTGTLEDTQQNWGGSEDNTQQNWDDPEENIQQNNSDDQYGRNYLSGNMNAYGSQPYQENNSQGNWPQNQYVQESNTQISQSNGSSLQTGESQSQFPKPSKTPSQTLNPTVTPTPVISITPVPTLKPTDIPKPSQTPIPIVLNQKTSDSNSVKSKFFKNFLFEESDFQKAQHLPDAAVVFLHERKIRERDYPSITLKSSGSVQILSFRINDRECAWHWENNRIIADTPVRKGDYQIELLVLSQGGKMVYMDPWKFSA